jgi:hypothetical protein
MILDGATIIGAGEAGREGIIPLEGRYMRPFAQAIAEEMPNGGDRSVTINITIDGNPDRTTIDEMVRELKLAVRTA